MSKYWGDEDDRIMSAYWDVVEFDLDDHHPPCRGGCGQLADECECPRLRTNHPERSFDETLS